jgi:hypothetical protein
MLRYVARRVGSWSPTRVMVVFAFCHVRSTLILHTNTMPRLRERARALILDQVRVCGSASAGHPPGLGMWTRLSSRRCI